ncbi:hypothetical protein LCGC14_3136190 [marine sediment metagenome]|uniref:Uncharacterized protein n=1 Tax=marine sediment metagenome TaxID=412755 RepID=A0A0F8WM51_9ZZZZ
MHTHAMAYQRTLSVQHVGTGNMAATVLSPTATVREFEATARSALGIAARTPVRLSVAGAPGEQECFLRDPDARMADAVDRATRVVHVLEAAEGEVVNAGDDDDDDDVSAFGEIGSAAADDDPLVRAVATRVRRRALELARGIAARDQKLRLQRGAPITLASV